MAHTYAGVLLARASSAANPITASLTVPSGVTVVVLLLKTVGATYRAGANPTWGQYTFQIGGFDKAATSPEASAELHYLLNPLPGTATLTIPNTGAATIYREVVGAKAVGGGTSRLDRSGSNNATSTNPTPGATLISNPGMFVVAVTAGGWTTWAPTAQAGIAITNADDGADGYGSQYVLNPTVGASLDLNWTFATSDDWGAVVAAFSDYPAQAFENYKSVKCASAGVISLGERIR